MNEEIVITLPVAAVLHVATAFVLVDTSKPLTLQAVEGEIKNYMLKVRTRVSLTPIGLVETNAKDQYVMKRSKNLLEFIGANVLTVIDPYGMKLN